MMRALSLALLLGLLGCDKGAGEPCQKGDCADGLTCTDGVCLDPATHCRVVPRKKRCEREGAVHAAAG